MAKFVDKNLLRVKYQRAVYDKEDGTTVYDIRIYSAMDSLNYSSGGFIINDGDEEQNISIKKAYTSYDGIKPTQIGGENANYLFVHTLSEIPAGTTLTITPYWVTMDGTTVYGARARIILSAG